MKIDKSLYEDYAVLTLKGEFDTFYCPMLMEEVDSLVERGVCHIILNMRLVRFINSTALGAIIRAHKRCKAEGGELVVDRPSGFVRDIVGKLGIDQVVPLFDSEEAATKHIVKALNAEELAGDAPVDQEKVLITFPDPSTSSSNRSQELQLQDRAEVLRLLSGKKLISGTQKPLVGTMSNADGSRLQFVWSGKRSGIDTGQAKKLFFEGSDLRLKFQVKLIKRSFFEIGASVREVQDAGDDNIRVTVTYDDISESDRAALRQFAEDMEFLKRQLPGT